MARPNSVPLGIRQHVLAECQRSRLAYEQRDIGYFVDNLCPEDKWRILAEYFDDTSFFDIETSGFEIDAQVTVIACWHGGRLHTFVEHENLDEFLLLLDEIKLLASFNGSSFDVPRILDAFHIPELPCPHLDLRWASYHAGFSGGLKDIADELGIQRPSDLANANGELAIELWLDWQTERDANARSQLVRYCAADVMLLALLGQHLGERQRYQPADLWCQLPEGSPTDVAAAPGVSRKAMFADLFGTASPSKLRTRQRFAG